MLERRETRGWRARTPDPRGARAAALVFLALAASWGEFFEEELTFQHRQSSLRKSVGEAIENVARELRGTKWPPDRHFPRGYKHAPVIPSSCSAHRRQQEDTEATKRRPVAPA